MTKSINLTRRHSHDGPIDNTGLTIYDIKYMPTDEEYDAAIKGVETWAGAIKYGRWATWCLLALFGFAILCNVFYLVLIRRKSITPSGTSRKLWAFYRFFSYYHPQTPAWCFKLPSLAKTMLITAYFAWTTALTFGVKPYYRITMNWGSPPLALRGEWFATALFPWVLVMAAKVSPVTLLTGVSHERLQVYHQWGARTMLFFATIHGIPYFYQPLKDWGGAGLDYWFDMRIQWTGVAAWATLFWLVFSSFTTLRNWHYELWIAQHILTAILFLFWMFYHTEDIMDSWYYCYAGLGVMIFSYIGRLYFKWRMTGVTTIPAEVEVLNSQVTRLSVDARAGWYPGSHVFLRFPTINILECHPFTASSVTADCKRGSHELVLLLATKSGMTKRLITKAGKTGGRIPVMIDGPYGGIRHKLARHDRLLLFAGGSGITFTIPLLMAAIQDCGNIKRVDLIWAVPNEDRVEWLQPFFDVMKTANLGFTLNIEIYVTRISDALSNKLSESGGDSSAGNSVEHLDKLATPVDDEKYVGDIASTTSELYQFRYGRPKVAEAVQSLLANGTGQSVAVGVCGPHELTSLVCNEVAKLQLSIMRGKSGCPAEVVLHSEAFNM